MIDIVNRLRKHADNLVSAQLVAWRGYTDDQRKAAVQKTIEYEAATEIEKLRDLLKECADNLEQEIKYSYAGTETMYPSEKRKFDRDMDIVIRAREVLDKERS